VTSLRIGLTGGIGSGKSTVALRLAALGANLVDTDAIARALTEAGGAAVPAIAAAFGSDYIDAHGALDRQRMRALVFADGQAKVRLEQILHPLIGAETEAIAARSTARVQVFDVPLLVESGRWRDRVDRVWVVDCLESTQLDRVVQRSGWSPAAVQAVIDRQASRAQRRAAADAVIYNEGIDLGRLHRAVDWLWQQQFA
jgi:dephospho-CoA kinase